MITENAMMVARRTAIDAVTTAGVTSPEPFVGMVMDLADYPDAGLGHVPSGLVADIAARLGRSAAAGPGAVVLRGVLRIGEIGAGREFHEQLFAKVWQQFRRVEGLNGSDTNFRIKVGVMADGAIPEELYGSRWSFKQLHIDRDALLFSHLYGPVDSFTGGRLLLVDIRTYMLARRLSFDDVFDWSNEVTDGSKPVVRPEHSEAALAACGIEVEVGPDEILFVNNTPGAGIVHGATAVIVGAQDKFCREYHRCSVKSL